MIETVTKRDGRTVTYDRSKIENAVARCFAEGQPIELSAAAVARAVESRLFSDGTSSTSVERIQDVVGATIMQMGAIDAANRYIVYRFEHAKLRDERPIPDAVREAYAADDAYFPTPLQRFQFMDKYSRFSYDLGRRETWVETVSRAVAYLEELARPYADLGSATYDRIRDAILTMRVMPSMRLLAMAGDPARRDSATIYNCSYLPADSLDAFREALLISMAGCGVGFSVERQYVDQLPTVKHQIGLHDHDAYVVEDSAEGWGRAIHYGMSLWMDGADLTFDYSLIRPMGAVLKTKGGRASGPEPLRAMLDFARSRILARQGRRLRPIDAHDIMCAVGNAAVSGGVRRTAMISLFDEDDADMLAAKAGDFEHENSQRWNANNSMVWESVATMNQADFLRRFMAMVESGRGEPGIFSRDAAQALAPTRRKQDEAFGCNPCGEITLRPYQFCNLSAAIVRAGDTPADLLDKVEVAAIIGTIQSLATNFPNLRPIWQKNCEEERLLGVDITGQLDNPRLLTATVFQKARERVVETNRVLAHQLGINPSAATTCVKPSGNTSKLVNCASGLHARWSRYQIARARVATTAPIYKVLRDAGVPMQPENGQTAENAVTWVASFPLKAPDGAITRNDRSAVEQCNWWLRNKIHWTEHNPSVTITYRPHEIIDLIQWIWEHRTQIGGMAFLPSYDAQFAQLPNEEITKREYERLVAEFPSVIDWSKIYRYEADDQTKAAQELACSAGYCEVEA